MNSFKLDPLSAIFGQLMSLSCALFRLNHPAGEPANHGSGAEPYDEIYKIH
jgi:hypothetical protein